MGYNFNKSATEHKWETIVIYNLFLIVSHCLLLFLIFFLSFIAFKIRVHPSQSVQSVGKN